MADIELVRAHSEPIARARALVQKTADELAPEHDLSSEWHGNTLHFHRTGVDGQIIVTASEIRLHANLSFLLKPLKGRLVDRIERTFDKLFGTPGSRAQTKKPAGKIARTAG